MSIIAVTKRQMQLEFFDTTTAGNNTVSGQLGKERVLGVWAENFVVLL
jgi:hypothetical protein